MRGEGSGDTSTACPFRDKANCKLTVWSSQDSRKCHRSIARTFGADSAVAPQSGEKSDFWCKAPPGRAAQGPCESTAVGAAPLAWCPHAPHPREQHVTILDRRDKRCTQLPARLTKASPAPRAAGMKAGRQ